MLLAVGEQVYSVADVELARAVASSVEFFAPPVSQASAGWKEKFSGRCVCTLSSSGSTGASSGGYSTGSYTSSKSKYYLHPDGSFQGGSRSMSSFDSGGGFGSVSSGSGPEAGTWAISSDASGDLLQLRYPDGSVASYRLETGGKGHTLLDGDRWFVVSYAECDDL